MAFYNNLFEYSVVGFGNFSHCNPNHFMHILVPVIDFSKLPKLFV